MATAQENADLAIKQTSERIELEVAMRLKTYWPQIGTVAQLAKPADDEAYLSYARQLIDEGKFSATKSDGTKTEITLDALNDKIRTTRPEVLESLGVSSVRDLVPTRGQVNAIAGEMGEAAKENTGSIGFLGGATLSAALRGFFSWIAGVVGWMFGGEKGSSMPGLYETIAKTAASDVRDSTTARLQKLRDTDPTVQGLLTDKRISEIGDGAYQATTAAAGYAARDAEPAPTLASVSAEALRRKDVGEMVYKEVKTETETAMINNMREELAKRAEIGQQEVEKVAGMSMFQKAGSPLMVAGQTEGQYVLNHFGSPDEIRNMPPRVLKEKLSSFNKPDYGVPTGADVDGVSALVAKAVEKVTTQKDYTYRGKPVEQLSSEEFGRAVEGEITASLEEAHRQGKHSFLMKEASEGTLGVGKTEGHNYIPTIATKAAEAAKQNHVEKKFSFLTYLEGAQPAPPVTVSAPAPTPAKATPEPAAPAKPILDDKGIPVAQAEGNSI